MLAQSSKDRYVKGDSYQWATANLRLIQGITENFEMQYDSYQYMDLRPEGYNSRNAVSGSFYKLTVAPTLKASDVGEFLKRPEIRLFATGWTGIIVWINTPAMMPLATASKAGGEWNFGVQMETGSDRSATSCQLIPQNDKTEVLWILQKFPGRYCRYWEARTTLPAPRTAPLACVTGGRRQSRYRRHR